MASSAPEDMPPDETRAPAMLAITWIETAICVILIIARFIARIRIRGLGWDDWTMLVSVILFIVMSILYTYMATIGGFRHIVYLTPEEQLRIVKFNWCMQPVFLFNFGLSKLSVGLLILRLIGPNVKWRRYMIWALNIVTMVISVLACIFVFVQCDPPEALWNPALMKTASCWNQNDYMTFAMSQGAFYVFVDVAFAVIPLTIIWNLNMERKKKFGLGAILSLGFLAAAMGCIKEPFLHSLTKRADLPWTLFPLLAVTSTEIAAIIWAGCIPTLRPIFSKNIAHTSQYSGYVSYGTKSEARDQSSSNQRITLQQSYNVTYGRDDGYSTDDRNFQVNIEAAYPMKTF